VADRGAQAAGQKPQGYEHDVGEVVMGFASYASYGWTAFGVLSKDYRAPVRVEAAQKLVNPSAAPQEPDGVYSHGSGPIRLAVTSQGNDPKFSAAKLI